MIGGIAVIVWTDRFLRPADLERLGISATLASKDLDVKGGQAHAEAVLASWGPTAKTQMYLVKDRRRSAWAVESAPRGTRDRKVVELTEVIPGVGTPHYAIRMQVQGVEARVLDPISCLLAKADVLGREVQANQRGERHDLLHVQLLCEIVPRYLEELRARQSVNLAAEVERAKGALLLAGRAMTLAKAGMQKGIDESSGGSPRPSF